MVRDQGPDPRRPQGERPSKSTRPAARPRPPKPSKLLETAQSAPQHKPQSSSSHSTGAKPAAMPSTAKPQTDAKPSTSGSAEAPHLSFPNHPPQPAGKTPEFEILHDNMVGGKKHKPNGNADKRSKKTADRQAKARKPKQQNTQSAPVAMATKSQGRVPSIHYKGDGSSCIVSHRERIGTVLGSVAFTTTKYMINPGLVGTFPWLSAVANRFETYRFKSLTFHYKTKTATTALGDVIMITDYDAAESAPESSIQAESYQAYADCAPWQNQSMGASHQNLVKFPQRYTRDTTPPSSTDLKTYDVGNFYICTENQASAALVGYLYVEYTVELFTPHLRSSDFYISGGSFVGGGTQSQTNPLGTTPTTNTTSRGVSVDAASVLTIANPGSYLVTAYVGGTTVSAVTLTASANCTVSSYWGSIANGAATAAARTFTVVVTGFNGTAALTATAASVSTSTYVAVASIPVGAVSTFDLGDMTMVLPDYERNVAELKRMKAEILTCQDAGRRASLLADYKGLAERLRQ